MSQSERIVVIGGAGFIGQRLTSLLANSGSHVVVVSRSAGSRHSNDSRVEYQAGSVTDAERISQLIAGAAVVYDVAMTVGFLWEDWERDVIPGAMNVANACLQHGVRRLIYTSTSAAIYLGKPGTATEATLGNDAERTDRGDYARAKAIIEKKLLELHRTRNLPVVITRPALVMGDDGRLVHPGLGEVVTDLNVLGLGQGDTPMPCVLVDDVAQALFLAKDAPGIEGLTFNLVGDVRPTASEFVSYLKEKTLRNFRFHPRSVWSVCGGELGRYLLKKTVNKPGNRMVTFREIRTGSFVTQLDCSLAKEKLGWKPVSDRAEFFRQAVDVKVKPISAGDLRLEAAD